MKMSRGAEESDEAELHKQYNSEAHTVPRYILPSANETAGLPPNAASTQNDDETKQTTFENSQHGQKKNDFQSKPLASSTFLEKGKSVPSSTSVYPQRGEFDSDQIQAEFPNSTLFSQDSQSFFHECAGFDESTFDFGIPGLASNQVHPSSIAAHLRDQSFSAVPNIERGIDSRKLQQRRQQQQHTTTVERDPEGTSDSYIVDSACDPTINALDESIPQEKPIPASVPPHHAPVLNVPTSLANLKIPQKRKAGLLSEQLHRTGAGVASLPPAVHGVDYDQALFASEQSRLLNSLHRAMCASEISHERLRKWENEQGGGDGRKSHSKRMALTFRSRKRLQDCIFLAPPLSPFASSNYKE